jgi:hypothetical protein
MTLLYATLKSQAEGSSGEPKGPRIQCRHQGGLNSVLNCIDVLHAHPSGEHSDQLAVFVVKEVLDELGRRQGVLISLTSTLDPGIQQPGLWRATSTGSSRLSAETIM